jgi:hypothetical protein
MKLRDLVPNSYIHVSVSDLYTYILRLGLHILPHRYMNVGIGTEAVQFHCCDYVNRIFFAVCVSTYIKELKLQELFKEAQLLTN